MTSIATTPQPSTPYTFTSAADSDAFLGAQERRDFPELNLDVVADPAWPGLRHALRMEGVLLLLKVTFLVSGIPLAIGGAAGAWTVVAIFIGLAALLPTVALVWSVVVPTTRVIFDWRARTIRGRTGPGIPFDVARLELAPAPHGHAVWARGPERRFLIGFFRAEPVARAYLDRLESLLRNKRYGTSGFSPD